MQLFGYEAIDIVVRQLVKILPVPAPTKTTRRTQARIITHVTPSPSAEPIPITAQYQRVTSYIPQITVCALPPMAYASCSFSNPSRTFPPYLNYSVVIPTGTGTCLTAYSPTLTPICYSVLDGLASRITITDRTREITFSKDTGSELQLMTPSASRSISASRSPYVRTLNTFFAAP